MANLKHKEVYRTYCEDYGYTQYVYYCSCGEFIIGYSVEQIEEKIKNHMGGKKWIQKTLNKKANY